MGSCFAETMGQRLRESGFNTVLNPFGVVYNPSSIAQSVQRLMHDEPFQTTDLVEYEHLYHSFNHHGSFSGSNPKETLVHMNAAYWQAVAALKASTCLMLTFGTSWVYTLRETGEVVANCHKFPAVHFDRHRLSITAIVDTYISLFDNLFAMNPALRIVLTVSPIRHQKDGFHANNISKSILLLATESLVERYANVYYYPSYELVMDDLRDYRFYADDMLHPSPLATNYIWEHFSESFFGKQTKEMARQVQQIRKAMEHRPFHPDEAAYRRFAQKNLAAIEGLVLSEPKLDLREEKAFFERIIRGR
jgi:hypothetical protein